jgi:chemotaxis protein methyltransferase CheR
LLNKAFTNSVFLAFREFIHKNYGIYYADVKKDLVKLKIDKCMLKSGISSYNDYFNLICSNAESIYINHFVDEITVNKTDFFREAEHYNFIKANLDFIMKSNSQIIKNREIKLWSMACSTGQEAYTAAMVLKETMNMQYHIRVLATDISNRVLKIANAGIYPLDIVKDIEPLYLQKYFNKKGNQLEVRKEIKDLITFRQFNLINSFPISGQFDIIFCRNVMIYFDLDTQQQLLDKIYNCLSPGGLLMIGQSESLLNKKHLFKFIKSSIHIK